MDAKPPHAPDYFGMIYFSAAALMCLYYVFQDEGFLPALVIAPLFFSLISGWIFSFLLNIPDFFVTKGFKNKLDMVWGTFWLYLFFAGLIVGIYFLASPETRSDLISVKVAFVFGISIIHTIVSTYPRDRKDLVLKEKFKVWFFRSTRIGMSLGISAVAAIVFSIMVVGLLFGKMDDFESFALKLMIVFIVGIGCYYGLQWTNKKLAKKYNKPDANMYTKPSYWHRYWSIFGSVILTAVFAWVIITISHLLTEFKLVTLIISLTYVAMTFVSYYAAEIWDDAKKDKYKPTPHVKK